MSKATLSNLSIRIRALEATIERMNADRQTFIRHQQTLGRHLRRVLNDNKELRLERMRRDLVSANGFIAQGFKPSALEPRR